MVQADVPAPGDPNMLLARVFAESLGPAQELPTSLAPVNRRADFIDRIDGPLVERLDLQDAVRTIAIRVRTMMEVSHEYMPDVPDCVQRLNLALRLWAGCLSAAKTIAYETRSGQNTPEMRTRIMEEVDRIAADDKVFRAGVEAAPEFKHLRKQGYSLEGVPENSSVRRYA